MEAQQQSHFTQPSAAADMAPLLNSKDSNKAINLENVKTDLLHILKIIMVNYNIEDSNHQGKSYRKQ